RDEANVVLPDDLFVRIPGPRAVRDRLHAIRRGLDAREHRDHAGRGEGGHGHDAIDARMRVRGAHEARVDLTRPADVVAAAAAAGEQARVLLAEDVLAYALRRGCGSRLKKGHDVGSVTCAGGAAATSRSLRTSGASRASHGNCGSASR